MCQPGLYSRLPADAHPRRALPQPSDPLERALHLRRGPHDPDQVLHHHLQLLLDLVGPLAVGPAPRSNGSSA